jgi:5'-nucleotidase
VNARSNAKTNWIFASLLLCTIAVASGCNQNKKNTGSMAMQPSSLDVPAAPVAAVAPAYTPPQPAIADPPPTQQPVISDTAMADVQDTSAAGALSPAPTRTHSSSSYASASSARKASYSTHGTSAAGGTKYTIKKGDSLWSIAQAHYGNGNKWKLIANANPKLNPDKIQAGQTIVLP